MAQRRSRDQPTSSSDSLVNFVVFSLANRGLLSRNRQQIVYVQEPHLKNYLQSSLEELSSVYLELSSVHLKKRTIFSPYDAESGTNLTNTQRD